MAAAKACIDPAKNIRWRKLGMLISAVLMIVLIEVTFEENFVATLWSSKSLACSSASLPLGGESYQPINLLREPDVHTAFSGKLVYVRDIKNRATKHLHTKFAENRNVNGYGLTSVTNVCMLPDGPIVLVGMSEDQLWQSLEKSQMLQAIWRTSYNCTSCSGYRLVEETPEDAAWVTGNSTHLVPYLGNVFHNFADRVWPHVAGFQFPLNTTTPKPINHIVVPYITKWLQQTIDNAERSTFLFQIRILGFLSPDTDFLVMDGQKSAVCYENLVLDCEACDRISTMLGADIFTPAILRYRSAAFSYLGLPEPEISAPPRPLRVTFYGRNDTKRRRVANPVEVIEHLRSWKQPELDVCYADEMMARKEYNQSFPETVSLMSQTDIFITVHGANTWASLFLPKGAAVVEIYGPCGPSTWIKVIAIALNLKHSTESNPWGERVASSLAGNTTECLNAVATPDFTLDLEKLDSTLRQLAIPHGPGDRIPLHWLYNWTSHSYYH